MIKKYYKYMLFWSEEGEDDILTLLQSKEFY